MRLPPRWDSTPREGDCIRGIRRASRHPQFIGCMQIGFVAKIQSFQAQSCFNVSEIKSSCATNISKTEYLVSIKQQ